VIDCNDFPRMVEFWERALGYERKYHVEDDWALLRDPQGKHINVGIQKVPEPRIGKNRLHFDLYTEDQEAEVQRLLSIGATRFNRVPEPGEDWVVLEDPEGNLFCIVVHVGSVVIDCNDFPRMVEFWEQALGYERKDHVEDDWALLRDPNGTHTNVGLQKVPEPRVGKNRLHLDLYAEDQEAEVQRLLSIGATRFDRLPEPGEDFVVLEDPEGNLFCVIDAGPE
jgi:catechol 2,3-dioxygenase-like lactoylglutathione lyase family enzyme